ncbi:ferritin-like domain-containing protein [Flavobacterium polysaccharolyticum]|uniref:PA2169 family four-helix-bundle protein n=1 Tax=Flavobacterium polysaccharolyticum TaxID=3133148 RepID=A0ABU9NRN3_9FLAO
MENEKTIEVLNTLITINNDRIEGYETAAKETEEQDLKTLFAQFSANSQKCKKELEIEVSKLGGTPAEGTMVSGKFYRVWMDIKAALTGKDRKTILNSCEYGEDMAKGTYEKVLKNDTENLSIEQQAMIKAQHILLVADHDHVKSMRDLVMAEK